MRTAALALATLVVAASLSACSKATPETTLLQAEDLVAPEGLVFDANTIVETTTLTDPLGITFDDLQAFFRQTPYKRSCFLETYQSNGVRASDAILHAAVTYEINPLIVLARAEADQGLLGERTYPEPASRVEYAFGCGCPGIGACDPALAGFDRQVECLARTLRQSLDEIAASKATAGGWGPGVETLTLDNVRVTPSNEATAALYQYDPIVGVGRRGNWLVWVLLNKYGDALNYIPPR